MKLRDHLHLAAKGVKAGEIQVDVRWDGRDLHYDSSTEFRLREIWSTECPHVVCDWWPPLPTDQSLASIYERLVCGIPDEVLEEDFG